MKSKTIAQIYHQRTKYAAADMSEAQSPIDWAAQPSPYKSYHSENKIDLSPYLPLRNNPFTQEEIEPPPVEDGLSVGIGEISRLLYFTNGVTGILQYPSGQSQSLRAAPTAGGLYPTEIYVATRALPSLHDGIYNFQVNKHSLVPVWEGNFWAEFNKYCLEHESIEHSNLIIIMTGVFGRSSWRYHERAYRRILLDTGHVIGNLFAYADREGLKPFSIERFIDQSLNRLLFLEPSEEGVLFMIALPRATNKAPCQRYAFSLNTPQNRTIDSNEAAAEKNPLFLKLHQGSAIHAEETYNTKEVGSREALPKPSFRERSLASELTPEFPIEASTEQEITRDCINLKGQAIDWGENIGTTILLRRSTRSFTGNAFSKETLASVMSYATAAQSTSSHHLIDPALLETYIVIQKIEGLRAGIYRYSPQKEALNLIEEGDFSKQCWHFCLGQDLARDAAALVIHTADLKEAMGKHGNRAYRYLHLDAGYIGQRINLAAIRLGIGVSGIGGFYDDEVNELLGLSLEKIIVYITTLGQPEGASYA